MTGPFPRASESGASDDEGAFAGDSREKSVVCCIQDLVAEEVVDVILLRAIMMSGVRGYGVNSEVALDIVNYIRWVIDVTDTGGRDGAEVGG